MASRRQHRPKAADVRPPHSTVEWPGLDTGVTGGTSIGSRLADMPPASHDEIAQQAYQLWEQRGRADGQESQDWYEAEQLLQRTRAESRPAM